MPKMKKSSDLGIEKVWSEDIDDAVFEDDSRTEDRDIGEYNLEKMALFTLNVNCARHMPALEDSLKPVERRILINMYNMGAYGTKKRKSSEIIGATMVYHPHSDQSIYNTLVGLAQEFKKGQTLIRGIGNFGTIMNPENYGHYRYTEAALSDYAYECFFDDYDEDCIETKVAENMTATEPVYLPAKFPNILIEGTTSIAVGFNCTIPPYNINDVVDVTKRLIKNPADRNFVIYPDIPTGCDLVDTGLFRQICETGEGTMTMRATTEIIDNGSTWIIRVGSIPWLSDLTNIHDSIVKLAKAHEISIKEVQNKSYAAHIKDPASGKKKMINIVDYNIIIDKAKDPYQIRAKLFKMSGLEKTVSVKFRATYDGLHVDKFGMADLLLHWIDSRREYLRRLYNKKNSRINAQLDMNSILVELTSKTNLEKVIKIVRNSTKSELIDSLVREYGMNTFQAKRIADMPMRTWTKEAHDQYVEERKTLLEKKERIMEIIRSEKQIDKIILNDLDALRKYATPRKSQIIKNSDLSEPIPDTNHILVLSKKGYLKKLPAVSSGRTKGYGPFASGDYPIQRVAVNNRDIVMVFDSLGRYSIIPVYNFENNSPKDPGSRVYDTTRLEGEIVSIVPWLSNSDLEYVKETTGEDVYLLTITKNGMIKKTDASEYNSIKVAKNSRACKFKNDDSLIAAGYWMESRDIFIYTRQGSYTIIRSDDISLTGKDSQGVIAIDLIAGDEVAGFCFITPQDEFIVTLTEKGMMKKVPISNLGSDDMRRRKSTYLTYLHNDDLVDRCVCASDSDKIYVCNRMGYKIIDLEDIPELSRRAKGTKLVPIPVGDNIITMFASKHSIPMEF